MVNEELVADLCGRVDLDPGDAAAGEGEQQGGDRNSGVVQRVGYAMSEQRLHAGPGGEDLQRADAAGRGIAVTRGGDVAGDLAKHSSQGPETEHGSRVDGRQPGHGAKNGSEM